MLVVPTVVVITATAEVAVHAARVRPYFEAQSGSGGSTGLKRTVPMSCSTRATGLERGRSRSPHRPVP